MATRSVRREQTRDHGEEADLSRALAFLAEQGIAPDAAGAYPVDAILGAIRARGWEATLKERDGEWVADIGDERIGPDGEFLIGGDVDRETALLRVLAGALLWLDRDAVRQHFERETRERMGIGGEEFLRRYDAGEYDEAQWEPGQHRLAYLVDMVGLVR